MHLIITLPELNIQVTLRQITSCLGISSIIYLLFIYSSSY